MRKVYFDVDENRKVLGWGTTPISENCIELKIEEDHPALDNAVVYYIDENDNLVFDSGSELTIIKYEKEKELSHMCSATIRGRFGVNIGGEMYYFSNDVEAQMNFDKMQSAFDKGRIPQLKWTAYDEDGEVARITLNPSSFEAVYLSHLNHIQTNISHFRDILMPLVNNATTASEVEAIHWDMVIPPSP